MLLLGPSRDTGTLRYDEILVSERLVSRNVDAVVSTFCPSLKEWATDSIPRSAQDVIRRLTTQRRTLLLNQQVGVYPRRIGLLLEERISISTSRAVAGASDKTSIFGGGCWSCWSKLCACA